MNQMIVTVGRFPTSAKLFCSRSVQPFSLQLKQDNTILEEVSLTLDNPFLVPRESRHISVLKRVEYHVD